MLRLRSRLAQLGILALCFATKTMGQELNWTLVSAQSTGTGLSCDSNSVHMLFAGTNLALLYENMTTNMVGGVAGAKSQKAACTIVLNLKIPKGYHLTSATSTILGGAEKSVGASGSIDSSTFFGAVMMSGRLVTRPGSGYFLRQQRLFSPREQISEPLIQIENSRVFSNSQRKAICDVTKTRPMDLQTVIYLQVSGSRRVVQETAIVGVDSTDANLSLELTTAPCSQL